MSKKLHADLVTLAEQFALDVIEAVGRASFAELSALGETAHLGSVVTKAAAEAIPRSMARATTTTAQHAAARQSPSRSAMTATRVTRGPGRPKSSGEPRNADDARGRRSVTASKDATQATRALDPALFDLAVAFFAERGRKGATNQQVAAHLDALGFTAPGDVVETLAARGAVRDAGFRRAAGNGNATAPVYVLN